MEGSLGDESDKGVQVTIKRQNPVISHYAVISAYLDLRLAFPSSSGFCLDTLLD